MSIYTKLMTARVKLQSIELKKSGLNKFAGYTYFELGDFLPAIQSIFKEVGLCDVISFTHDLATMAIYDSEDGTSLTFTSPMGSAELKGCHEVQNIGAVETYQRRYLYTTALAVSEHDALDATLGNDPAPKLVVRPVPKAEPVKKDAPAEMEGVKDVPWSLKVTTKPGTDVQAWAGLVCDVAKVGLTQCASEADVMAIFKVNRSIFDRLKLDSQESYDTLMTDFKTARSNFKKAA
jgi:hypothetical protein